MMNGSANGSANGANGLSNGSTNGKLNGYTKSTTEEHLNHLHTNGGSELTKRNVNVN